jgi:hypothetical protein
MEAGNVRSCAYCKQDKVWLYSGKKLKDGSKVYVDSEAARWSGRRCPDCERSRVYAAVRCDSFERDIILRQLEENGFEVASRSLPLKATKDGRTYHVGVKRAFTENGRIVLETPVEPGQELVALVFESVRILTTEQLNRLGGAVSVRGEDPAALPSAGESAGPTDQEPARREER